jgi:hypothetical protein
MNQWLIGPGGHGGQPGDSETCSTGEIIYDRLMAEANNDISSTEPALLRVVNGLDWEKFEVRLDIRKDGLGSMLAFAVGLDS